MPFATIPEAIEELRAGRMLVVVDDEDRENEGDLTMAAECITPEAINFMATHGRGLICLALTPERCDALHLPLVSPQNTSRFGTPFCESIDATDGRHHRNFRGGPGAHHSRGDASPTRSRPIWRGRAMCFPCVRAKAACWCARGRRRRRWIWRAWRDSNPAASSAKS